MIRPPPWLTAIETSTPVRRMTLIRQLGLKAYIDFPGAIHTRFSHALGVMELAGPLASLFITRVLAEGKHKRAIKLKDKRHSTKAGAVFPRNVEHTIFLYHWF